jgi:hypothetical protein
VNNSDSVTSVAWIDPYDTERVVVATAGVGGSVFCRTNKHWREKALPRAVSLKALDSIRVQVTTWLVK